MSVFAGLQRPTRASPRQFRRDVFIIASIVAAAILVSIVAIPQWLSKQARWEVLRSHVGQIGQLAASVVDGDLHRRLLDPANYSPELYETALKPLVRFHSANSDLFYVYTMVDRDHSPTSFSIRLHLPTCAPRTICARRATWRPSSCAKSTKMAGSIRLPQAKPM